MVKIKNALFRIEPSLYKLILPTRFYELNQVATNHSISESYQRLKIIQPIGIQYEWLARYCDIQNILDMEIGLEHCLKDQNNIVINLIGDDLETIKDDISGSYRVNYNKRSKDVYRVFGNMRFPLFNFTKKQMHKYSIEKGYNKILDLSWYCHRPFYNNQPCGKCDPCKAVIREGLGWRMPLLAKILYYSLAIYWFVNNKNKRVGNGGN
jgi:hypothetical protein